MDAHDLERIGTMKCMDDESNDLKLFADTSVDKAGKDIENLDASDILRNLDLRDEEQAEEKANQSTFEEDTDKKQMKHAKTAILPVPSSSGNEE